MLRPLFHPDLVNDIFVAVSGIWRTIEVSEVTSSMTHDAYISFDYRDREEAEKLARFLQEAQFSVSLGNLGTISAGTRWSRSLYSEIDTARCALVLVGPNHISHWQELEIATLLSRSSLNSAFKIIFVLGPGADPSFLPPYLNALESALEVVDLRESISSGLARLADLIPRFEKPRIFICHAKEDELRAEDLRVKLLQANFDPWYDKDKLAIGDFWKDEILRAIQECDFFAACLSKQSVKKRGFVQKEIRAAVNEYQLRPHGLTYLLPIRFESVAVPRIRLDDETTLEDLQWIDLFEGDQVAIENLVKSIARKWASLNA